jgi:hypothetical protein
MKKKRLVASALVRSLLNLRPITTLPSGYGLKEAFLALLLDGVEVVPVATYGLLELAPRGTKV